MDESAAVLAARLSRRLLRRKSTIAVVESCTGGLLASTLTDISGASKWFTLGWVTYSNKAKSDQLGIDINYIEKHGAVSTQVASALAEGGRLKSSADLVISVTGIAGPRADESKKEVGLVHVGISTADGKRVKQAVFGGNRAENKDAFVTFALYTAIEQWDKLRDRDTKIEEKEQREREIEEDEMRLAEKKKVLEEAKATTLAPWQNEVWLENDRQNSDNSVGEEVDWDNSQKD
ncbi:MAG: CinA family protein [Euryarchaeota archaeon]|jgi:PncC family amidohydrolase|nr:CinA family protein [Euryarchaeota archaeon]MBT3971389.1 CinA family protein [Euryarchaeota archaeon]MBT4406463.1 CinA family protein [Euryarchaeota archaeon]MBT6645443.1 CinA family protein [Euryarchaeota archaeon]